MDLNFIECITIITLIINTVALVYVIYQAQLSNQSLSITRKSVDDTRIQRQLEILPKFTYVIEIQVELERWKKDLQEKRMKLDLAIKSKDEKILKKLSETHIKNPKDLHLSRFLYDNMPSWLREIWMSGAQYYFNTIASSQYLWDASGGGRYDLAKIISEGCLDSEESINILLGYVKEMIPSVILNTPASLSDGDFLRD
jgi:hypothetical protein